jgi:hypothetical protein
VNDESEPGWVAAVRAADRDTALSRAVMEQMADRRAAAIAVGVAEAERLGKAGRGGRSPRFYVADRLGVHVSQVDKALARAKSSASPVVRNLPGPAELLERLYAAELAAMEPLTGPQRRALRFLAGGLLVDVTWLEQLGELLAGEYAEAAHNGEVPADEDLVKAIAGWSPLRALAVLHSLADEAPRDGEGD